MSAPHVRINTVLDSRVFEVPYNASTTAEDVCVLVCKQLGVMTIARHLFALRIAGKPNFLQPSAHFTKKNNSFDLRIRYKVPHIANLRKIDEKAYDYYFHQARNDILDNKIPDIIYEKYRRELVGLGITDMYRVMLEKDIPRETVENEYKKYIPKEVLKRHAFFIKKPIHDNLGKLQKSQHDAKYVKTEYLKQLDLIAPEYLSEGYEAVIDEGGSIYDINIKIVTNYPNQTALKYYSESKGDQWHHICTIEELGYISIRDKDGTVEISRKNGIPYYLKFSSNQTMFSFISLLDGYYRLTCKWIFNICKDVPTPSLQKLYAMKCHGPVGGEFSYAKLEEKRSNRAGCFIIRESDVKYNDYYIDVCTKDSTNSKPNTFKLERITGDEFIFNDDLTRYKSIQQLMAAYNDPNGAIFLQECVPPSEYDESPLLLCRSENIPGDLLTDSAALSTIMPTTPLCINCKDLQVFKDRKCLKWNKDRSKVKEATGYTSYDKFPKNRFPELDVSKAKKYCRNPNGDLGGPWCFVEDEDTDDIEREYCDIPFCHITACEVFARNSPNYTHYTDFNNTLSKFSFGVKLWDSDAYSNASASLALSLVALPLSGQEIEDTGVGLEIVISNKGSALRFGNKDKPEFEDTRDVLKSHEYTMFTLSWTAPFISLSYEGQIKSIFLAEYRTKNNLLGFRKNQFNFYSVRGTDVFFQFLFCMDDFECDVHTTTGPEFQQFWPLKSNEVGHELQFHLRAFHSVYLVFVPTPSINYPNAIFAIQKSNRFSRISVSYKADSTVIIKELTLPDILDYWEFREFSVAFFADTLQFYWTKNSGTHMIFELQHQLFRNMRWFAPSSDTVAQWTFFCLPPEVAKPPQALMPECALDQNEEDYRGSQDVTSAGKPCVPWATPLVRNQVTNASFSDWNFCRDPSRDKKGTYCYTLHDKGVEKSACHLRRCKSEDCRMAGTGNDYVGKLAVTRSNRTCDSWFDNATTHRVEFRFLNESLYADLSLGDVQNYCRNPSRDVAGSWCYTQEKDVPKDACNVRDCDRPEENIMIVSKPRQGRKIYILPQWKITGLEFGLKQWNPDSSDGVQFDIFPMHGSDKIELILGAKNNEKILLHHNNELKKEKTFLHLIASGKWTDFWLVMRKGEISLGFKGVPNSFFEFVDDSVFDPMFLSFGTLEGNPVGFYFKPDQCHTENVSILSFSKILPIGIWSQVEKPVHKNVTLLIRGQGVVYIRLMTLPDTISAHLLEIDSLTNQITLSRDAEIITTKKFERSLFNGQNWTSFVVDVGVQNFLKVTKANEIPFIHYSGIPLLFYWFALGVSKGSVTWSANCEALDLDGPPRDGGWSPWSPWQCTVKCGGGQGYRTRNCTNPKPNILGKLCPGPHRSTGVCNDFTCGDVSPTTLDKIRSNLQTHQFSFVVNEGKSVVLENDNEMLKLVAKESPDAYHEWTLNGMFVRPGDRVKARGDDLVIRDVDVDDSGVYVCMLYRINKKKVVLRVISLAVVSIDYDIETRATRSLVIPCKSVVLGYIYSDLSLKLFLNGDVYKDFGTTMLAAVNSEHFDHLNMSHTGDWKCLVEQKDLKLSWVTNYVRVEVKKEPNFYTNLMEDEFSKPLFGWLGTEDNVLYALIFIVVTVLVVVVVFLVLYFKYCTFKSRQKKEGSRGITMTYRSMWKITKGKKIEVTMKILMQESCDKYLKEFLELAGQYAHLQSSSIVRMFGITLTSNVSLVLEHFRLGPLDQYLRDNKGIIKKEDLIEAASNLASALWHLKENGIVHGNIRCRKLMVNCHDENSFTVKLTDPGIHIAYASKEVHWIPVECYANLDYAKRSTAADVWAFATTLWEIFMFGEEIKTTDHVEAMRLYANGKRLPRPSSCDKDIYDLMRECWNADPHRRKQPQAVMRDINQILYQVYNSRRTHSYTKVFTKSNQTLQSVGASSMNSLASNTTQSTFYHATYQDDLIAASEVESNSSTCSSLRSHSQNWLMNSQEVLNCEDSYGCDFSNILSNFNFSTATTSLDSINSLQSIFELDQDCSVVLQGRIGQGFYGEVYKGTLEYTGNPDMEPRIVAIKKLKTTALSSCLQDFEREINIMKTLQHPNIVEILGVSREPDISLVMEFVQHGSLQSYLKINRESLHPKQLLKYALDIAKGMDYLGKKSVVHRDLAARNILVVDENHVKISDFGLAQVMGTNDYYILKTNRELPIKWYAPESLRDGKFSVRSDVWSYGVTMCEMFNCGEEPKLTNVDMQDVEGQKQQVFLNALESGARFPCPPMCPQAVYIRIIYPCWHADPHERSSFAKLVMETQDLLTQY